MTPRGVGASRLGPIVLALLATAAAPAAAAVPERAPLAIASPADVSDLAPLMEVRGTAAEAGGTIAWSIAGTDRAGEAPVAGDGSFAFALPTDGLHLTQIVRVLALGARGPYAERVLLLVDRDPGPAIVLEAPMDGTARAGALEVVGQVTGPVLSASWSIPELGRGGVLPVDGAGDFDATIDASGRDGPVTLWFRAEDRFGHLTLRAVRLAAPAAASAPVVEEPVIEEPAAEAPVGGEPAPVEPVVEAPDENARIEIIEPAGVGWYRARLSIAGRVTGTDLPPESLAWSVSGENAPGGEILVDSDGTFRLELATGSFGGDRTLTLAGTVAEGTPLEAAIALRDARRAPEVAITAPGTGGVYGAGLRLAGTVLDPYAGDPAMGGFESVRWEIAAIGAAAGGPARSGDVPLGPDGGFALPVSTVGLDGQHVISVVAVGRSGNTGRAAVRVARGESDIPSFSASAGDGVVTLAWEAADGGAAYDLYYAVDREVGDGAVVVPGVRPPFVLANLANGSRHVFRLKMRRAGEPDAWSVDRVVVPLGGGTLKPVAVGEYAGVRLSWRAVPGVARFDVQRSADPGAGWKTVAAGLAEPAWFDAAAVAGLSWYYRVKPAGDGTFASDPTPGAALAWAARALEPAGSVAVAGARTLDVNGGYAWVCGDGGVRVIDLSDPARPREVARLATGDALAIDVTGTLGGMVDRERGLVLLDLAEPRAPRELGARFVPEARDVALSTGVAYLACGTGGIRVVDIGDPRSPQRLGQVPSPDARAIVRHEGRLLVADAAAGLRIFDLAEPATPRPLGAIAIEGAVAVSALGARAAVTGTAGVSIVDIADPARPVLVATVAPGAVCAAVTAEGYAVAAGSTGISVLDPGTRGGRPIDAAAVPGATSLALEGESAYVLGSGTLGCFHLRILGRPAVAGRAELPGNVAGIAADGSRVLVAARSAGLLVFDVTGEGERREFRPATGFDARFAEDAAVEGAYAYVADGAAGLRILALGGTAREVARFQPAAVVHAVAVEGPLAAAAAGPAGVVVLDVSDPAAPRQAAAIPSPDARDVALVGSFLLVADAVAGLRSFDLSVPSRPVETATPLPPAIRVSAGRGWAIAVGPTGVTVIEWPGTGVPRAVGFHATPWAEDALRVGDRAVVAEGHRGVVVLDLADPASPRTVASLRDVNATSVAASGEWVLAAGAGSVAMLKIVVPPWLEDR